jgi:hypothetical protein
MVGLLEGRDETDGADEMEGGDEPCVGGGFTPPCGSSLGFSIFCSSILGLWRPPSSSVPRVERGAVKSNTLSRV